MLFIGTFLSKKRGTKGIAETLAESLLRYDIKIKLVSTQENKLLRIIDIVFSILFTTESKVHIDVFSGPAFRIAEVAAMASKFMSKSIYLTLHGGKLPEFYTSNEKRFQKLFGHANVILTPSKFLQKFFNDKSYVVQYLPNSIDMSAFPYQWKQPDARKILWVRGFTNIYNPALAVHSFAMIRKVIPTATLTMVGPDLGMLNEIKDLVDQNKLGDAVHFTGPVPNRELHHYYATHSVFINTTSYESFGMAVLEAACCGIPIVSSPVGEIPFLWETEKDILITNDLSAQQFSDCILRILENQVYADRLSKSARLKAEKFSIENILPQWISIIQK